MIRNNSPKYNYNNDSAINREEFDQIVKWVRPKSKVIDLGCGDGELLLRLKNEKNITMADGIEFTPSAVKSAKAKKINVWLGRVDVNLKEIKDKQYDYAISNVTLADLVNVEMAIKEMARISRYQLISCVNLGFILNRLELIFLGRMPKSILFGYKWYNTRQIRHFSLKDFEEYFVANNFKKINVYYFIPPRFLFFPRQLLYIFPNLFSVKALYFLEAQ